MKTEKSRNLTESEVSRAWEDLCDGCGKCCCIGKNIACPSLDTTTNSCTVYNQRHTTETCLAVTPKNTLQLHKRGILPASCAYVRLMQNKAPAKLSKWTGLSEAKLIPFKLAEPGHAKKYIEARDRWLSKRSTA